MVHEPYLSDIADCKPSRRKVVFFVEMCENLPELNSTGKQNEGLLTVMNGCTTSLVSDHGIGKRTKK